MVLGDQDRHPRELFAGEAPHGIAGAKQQRHAGLRQVIVAVDPLLGEPLQRQPQHPMAALLAQHLHLAAAPQVQHLELLHAAAAHLGLKGRRSFQQGAAVVAQGAGYHGLPLAEVVAVQQHLQARPSQQVVWVPTGHRLAVGATILTSMRPGGTARGWCPPRSGRPGGCRPPAGPPPAAAAGPARRPTARPCGW